MFHSYSWLCVPSEDDMRTRRQLPKRNTRLFLLRHPLAASHSVMSVSPQCPNWAPFFGFAGVASAVRAAPLLSGRRC
jgi:hypothetical protein